MKQSSYAPASGVSVLSPALQERVLTRLGFSAPPEPTHDNLCRLYSAWCRRVPFDNIRKLIHVRSEAPGPLPGRPAHDFFETWLMHGTGGTCWTSASALRALLQSLGYATELAISTILSAPDVPPNHGTVRVTIDGAEYLTDTVLLHGEPLRLRPDVKTAIAHPAWGVQCAQQNGKWHVFWRPLQKVVGLPCRIDSFGATEADYEARYDQTRGSTSLFNCEVTIRLNRDDRVIGLAFGKRISLEPNGSFKRCPVNQAERVRFLVEEAGISEEMALRLPEDIPTPRPSGARPAAAAAGMASEPV